MLTNDLTLACFVAIVAGMRLFESNVTVRTLTIENNTWLAHSLLFLFPLCFEIPRCSAEFYIVSVRCKHRPQRMYAFFITGFN